MTAAVILLATLVALYLARKAYPEALGERFDLDGPALTERGAMAVSAGIGLFAFAGIVGAWLAVAPVAA